MTMRSRPPTDNQHTAAYDPERAPHGAPPRQGGRVELATPTDVAPLPPPPHRPASVGDASPGMAASVEHSQPIRVISLKAPGAPGAPVPGASGERPPVKQHQARLRRLSEVVPQRQRVATPPGGLGYLAPPRDPREARTRRWRDYVLWGSVVLILAGAVTLAVWFLAGM